MGEEFAHHLSPVSNTGLGGCRRGEGLAFFFSRLIRVGLGGLTGVEELPHLLPLSSLTRVGLGSTWEIKITKLLLTYDTVICKYLDHHSEG